MELPFPLRGLHEDSAKGNQPAGTTSKALNVRSTDPITGRERGAQRSGMTAYYHSILEKNLLSFSNDLTVDLPWDTFAKPNITAGIDDADGGTGAFRLEDPDQEDGSAVFQDIDSSAYPLATQVQLVASLRVKREFCAKSRIILQTLGVSGSNKVSARVTWDTSSGDTEGDIISFVRTDQGTGTFASGYEAVESVDGSKWFRIYISMTYSPGQGGNGVRFEIQPETTAVANLSMFCDHPQLEVGAVPTTYQETFSLLDLSFEPQGQLLDSITYANKRLDYANAQPPTVDWSSQTPLNGVPRDIQGDRDGNTYVLDGNSGIIKYNGAGDQVWRIDVPIEDSAASLDKLLVDEFGYIYTGTVGGDEKKAKLYKYAQLPLDDDVDDPENRTRPEWTIDIGGSVRAIERREERLFVLVDILSSRSTVIVSYTAVESAVPVRIFARLAPFPGNGLALGDAGEIYTSHEPTTGDDIGNPDGRIRGVSGLDTQSGPWAVDWTPALIAEEEKEAGVAERDKTKIYHWFDAATLGEFLEDGEGVEEWRDKDNRNPLLRRPRPASSSDLKRPDPCPWREHGAAGHPYVQISASNGNSSLGSYLESPRPGTTNKGNRFNTEFLPSYEDAGWALVMAIQLADKESDDVVSTTILGHRVADTSLIKALVAHQYEETVDVGGALTWRDRGENFRVGSTAGDRPVGVTGAFDPNTAITIITLISTGGTPGNTRSIFRVNGVTVDEWDDEFGNKSKREWYLGFSALGNVYGQGEFNVYESIAFDRTDRTDPADNTVVSYPAWPGNSSLAGATTIEKTEGYLMHKYGGADLIHTRTTNNNSVHPYASDLVTKGPVPQADLEADLNLDELWNEGSMIVKYDAYGKIRWIMPNIRGTGHALSAKAGYLYSTGPSDDVNSSGGLACNVRKFKDTGDSFDLVDGWEWTDDVFTGTAITNRERLAVDVDGNIYWPGKYESNTSFTYKLIDTDGEEKLSYPGLDPDGVVVQNAYAVIPSRETPEYEGDDVTGVEFVWVATTGVSTTGNLIDLDTIHRTRLIKSTPNGLPPRNTRSVVVAGGSLFEFTKDNLTFIGDGLDRTAPYVDSVFLFGSYYLTDGQNYRRWTPRKEEYEEWTATSSGEMPKRCQLLTRYRGRAVLARSHDDPQSWFMSKIADPLNWNYVPAVASVDQATSGATSRAGLCPDVINAMVAYSDDTLIAGGDKELWMLRGDPEEGGRWDQISDVTGMAFGRSWCKSPEGILFFVGSRGGVYAMAPGRIPERLTQNTIERRMRDIDFTKFRTELIWNDLDEGFHVFFIPYPGVTEEVEHLFWSQKSKGWWPDAFTEGRSPMAMTYLDTDLPEDRRMMLLGSDLRLRSWDANAYDDDGVGIESTVRMGPLTPGGEWNYRFSHLQVVLADESDGAEARWYTSDRPDLPQGPVLTQQVNGGRSARSTRRVKGARLWLDIGSTNPNERWTYEAAYARTYRAGRSRSNL